MKMIFLRHPRLGGPELDMTPDGQFRTPPRPSWSARLLGYAILVAVVAAGLAVAALALWFALILIPVAIGAGLIAYGLFRWRLWQARRNRRQDIYRP
jgi:Flp pilus assembly protein TadB